jgi:hypothetical protein
VRKVIPSVRPAQPAPGNRATAQVDAFDPRGIDPDLPPGQRLRQPGNLRGLQLEGECRGSARHEGVGAQHCAHQVLEQPQDPVVVDRLDSVERFPEGFLGVLCSPRPCPRRVKGPKQRDKGNSRRLVAFQRIDRGLDSIGNAGLPQITKPRAKPVRLFRRQAHGRDQRVERVVFLDAGQNRIECGVDHLAEGKKVAQRRLHFQLEIMDPAELAVGQIVGNLLDHPESEIFQHGNGVGKRDDLAQPIDLQPNDVLRVVFAARKGDMPVIGRRQLGQPQDIGCSFTRGEFRSVTGAESPTVRHCKARCPDRADLVDQRQLQLVVPAARQLQQPAVQRFGVDVCQHALDDIMHPRQPFGAQFHIELPELAPGFPFQHPADPDAQVRRIDIARNINQDRGLSRPRVAGGQTAAAAAGRAATAGPLPWPVALRYRSAAFPRAGRSRSHGSAPALRGCGAHNPAARRLLQPCGAPAAPGAGFPSARRWRTAPGNATRPQRRPCCRTAER